MPTPPELIAALQQSDEDPDAKVLLDMIEVGADLTQPHEPEFVFEVAEQANAEALAQALSGLDHEVALYLPEDERTVYTVVAQRVMVLDLAELQQMAVKFEALAEEHEASYDGWGAEIVS